MYLLPCSTDLFLSRTSYFYWYLSCEVETVHSFCRCMVLFWKLTLRSEYGVCVQHCACGWDLILLHPFLLRVTATESFVLVVFTWMYKARVGCGSTYAAVQCRGEGQFCIITVWVLVCFSSSCLLSLSTCFWKNYPKPSIAVAQSEQQGSELYLLLLCESPFLVIPRHLSCTIALTGLMTEWGQDMVFSIVCLGSWTAFPFHALLYYIYYICYTLSNAVNRNAALSLVLRNYSGERLG